MLAKSKWSAAWLHYISIALKLAYNKNKLFKTLHCWPRDMLNFDFLDKVLENFLQHILRTIFQQKCNSCYLNWPNFIVWLPLLILWHWAIYVLQLFVNQAVTSIISIFLIKPFLYMTKKSRHKLKYLENKIGF